MKIFCILLLIALISPSTIAQDKKRSLEAKVELPNTHVLGFKSTINGHDYVLHIALPDSYDDTSKVYPVLYVLDAQYSFTFPLIRGIQAGLYYDGFIPEMIIVGITWPDDYDGNRGRDFTPTQMLEFQNSGGASQFLNVLKKEILTRIASSYRCDPGNATLTGGSLSGLFTLYTFFHEPGLFNHYIVGSPNLEYDNELIFKYEKAFAQQNHSIKGKIFIHTGEYEPVIYFNKFINQLKASKYKGLDVESLVVEKMSHVSEVAYGVERGLQFIFSEPDIIVDTELLDQYTGLYELNQDKITVSRTGNFLYIDTAFGKLKLYAKSNESFYAKGLRATGQFIKDNKGNVTGYSFSFENHTMLYKKLD